MTGVGPLAVRHWDPLLAPEFLLSGQNGKTIGNSQKLVTAMVIGSQRHQLRPIIAQCLRLVSPSLDSNDLFAAIDDSLPFFPVDELPLDTSSLLTKLFKNFPPSFYANLSLLRLISQARAALNVPVVAFVKLLAASSTLACRNRSFAELQEVVNNSLKDLEHVVTSEEQEVHDEVRIMAFTLILQISSAFSSPLKKSLENESVKFANETVVRLFNFIVEDALAVLCSASSTPSRERFCSILINAITDTVEKEVYIDKILLKLTSFPFDETNYALQRCLLRLFRDLAPLASGSNVKEAIFSKLLAMCESDFRDVRQLSSQLSLALGDLPGYLSEGFCRAVVEEYLRKSFDSAVVDVNRGEIDTFAAPKKASVFVHCKSMAMKCNLWEGNLVRYSYQRNNGEKGIANISFKKGQSGTENEQDLLLLSDGASIVNSLLDKYDSSKCLSILSFLYVGNLILQQPGERLKADSDAHFEALDAYFDCCVRTYYEFFGDSSPAFRDRSLGGYLTGREDPVWAILQAVAKNLASLTSVIGAKSDETAKRASISKIVKRVLFSTLHFGLLEEYSSLLCSAVMSWPDFAAVEFENDLCQALFSEDVGNQTTFELEFSEIRRGGGLALAFVALFNGLARIGRASESERILRQRMLAPLTSKSTSTSAQTAVFHVLRAVFSFVPSLGDQRGRTALTDDVANMALSCLKMSTPFQLRNAAIQTLSGCVRPVIAEGISSAWKFSRAFPTLWLSIRALCKTRGKTHEVLSLTAALSMLAQLNPVISPSSIAGSSCMDSDLIDDLLAIAISNQIATVRTAAAQALVSLACSDPTTDPVYCCSSLISNMILLVNQWCSNITSPDLKRNDQFLCSNSVHGVLLIIDRSIAMAQSSWMTSEPSATAKRTALVGILPIELDRCRQSIGATLKRLANFINPDAVLLPTLVSDILAKLS